MLIELYRRDVFRRPSRAGLQARWIPEPDEIRQMTDFFAWTAWTAAANRPGHDYSYTNNWPPEPLVGNQVTADAVVWSVISIIFLLGGIGLVLFFFGRYDLAGMDRRAPPAPLPAGRGSCPHSGAARRGLVFAGRRACSSCRP